MNVKRILAVKGKGVITIQLAETIKTAIQKMERCNIGSLVVLNDDGKMAGILTERHIIRQAPEVDNFLSKRVDELMESEVISGAPQDDLQSLMKIMTEKRIRHLPILEGEKLIGLVSIGDVLKVQRDLYEGEVTTLETQIMAN